MDTSRLTNASQLSGQKAKGQTIRAKRSVPLALILITYLLIGTLYAYHTPDWQSPDEPAHYNYIRQLADGHFPVIQPGDYDQEYQSLVISSGFAPQYSVESFEYEDYQPPLYYLLLTPLFWLSGGSLLALRLASVLFGAGVVTLTYLIGCRIFSNRRWLSLTATVFVAFLPQHVAMLASINNDSLAELLIAAIMFVLLHLVSGDTAGEQITPQRRRQWLGLGLLLGLGFLTKVTVYIMVPVIGAIIIGLSWNELKGLPRLYLERGLQGRMLLVFGPAIIIGALWWGRNLVLYGGLDLLGTQAHNQVVVGQPRTSEWIDERGLGGTLKAFVQTTFQSFWGQFGWMGVVMPSWVYRPLILFSLLTFGGLLRAAGRFLSQARLPVERDSSRSPGLARLPLFILISTFALSLAVYLVYNLTFVQHQGRYLYSSLVPIGLGVAAGWAALVTPFTGRRPQMRFLLPTGLAMILAGLDVVALFKFIVPALS